MRTKTRVTDSNIATFNPSTITHNPAPPFCQTPDVPPALLASSTDTLTSPLDGDSLGVAAVLLVARSLINNRPPMREAPICANDIHDHPWISMTFRFAMSHLLNQDRSPLLFRIAIWQFQVSNFCFDVLPQQHHLTDSLFVDLLGPTVNTFLKLVENLNESKFPLLNGSKCTVLTNH